MAEILNPKFFQSQAHFRQWLTKNATKQTELWVGFYKKDSGKPSMTYKEALDEALCFGWIDGVRYTIDERSYVIRFTPRRRGSIWSAVNMRRAKELIRLKRMQPAGLKAFEARDPKKSAIYSFEQRQAARLTPEAEARFKSNQTAWTFFTSQAPSYQRIAIYYVVSAKQEETRVRRLERLIDTSAKGKRLGP